MTATQTSTGAGSGELSAPVEHTDTDDPTGRVDYDGPRCGDCGSLVDEDERCDDCGDGEPHPYPCPTCGGNGCRACGDTGELVEWVR